MYVWVLLYLKTNRQFRRLKWRSVRWTELSDQGEDTTALSVTNEERKSGPVSSQHYKV